MIWTDKTFYLIICSGFLVYIVWGLLTGFMWELIDKLDPRRSEREGIKRQTEALTVSIADTEKHRDEIQARITTLEKEVQGLRASFSTFHQLVRAFLSGWLTYITQAFGTPGEAERRAEQARKVADETVGFLVGGN
jgi:chromosome segregation ATPase